MRTEGTTNPASDSANGALTRPGSGEPAPEKRRESRRGVCYQQGLILRWNGSTWSADADPTAGTFSPLYGAATLPGGTSEWAAGINAADHALVLSHG